MSRMKTFFKYFLVVVALYFISNIASVQLLKSTYKSKDFTTSFDSPKIEISECKATITNGYIKGIITNNTGKDLINKYLKLDFFSSRGVNVGTKYIDFGNLLNGESKEFESRFNFDEVNNVVASLVDESDLPKDKKLFDFGFALDDIKFDKMPWYVWLAATILILG